MLMYMTTLISLADARANLSEMIGRAEDHHERIVITVRGKPAAVLLGMYDYESIQETLDLLSDPQALADLEQSEKELAAGLGTALHDDAGRTAA